MVELKALNMIYSHVRNKGDYQRPNHPQMGGMWSADTYQLGDIKVMLADDGYTKIVQRGTARASSTDDRPVEYSGGADASWLLNLGLELSRS